MHKILFFRVYRKKLRGKNVVLMKKLPPTYDAALQHLKRVYHQASRIENY